MTKYLSKQIQSLSPSLTLEISAKAKAMKAQGINIINFSVGEPDFDTPQYIKDAAVRAIEAGHTKYTPVPGIPALREAIAAKLNNENAIDCKAENIIVSTGAKQPLLLALMAILNPGDEVLVPIPYWVSYPEMVHIAGGITIPVPTSEENDYKVTPELLDKYITNKTKCIMLNSPSNPSGVVYSKEDLVTFADWVVENDLYVISDEIYEKLVYDVDFVSLQSLNPEIAKRTITVNGFSKAYAMTGWRLGYACADLPIIKLMNAIQGHMTSNASSMTQYAGLAALTEKTEDLDRMFNVFKRRRDNFVEILNSIDDVTYIYPGGAFYTFVDVSAYYGKSYNGVPITDSVSMASELLEHERIALTPGIAFGDDRFVRFSYALADEDLVEGLTRFKSFLDKMS